MTLGQVAPTVVISGDNWAWVADFSSHCSCQLGFLTDAATHFPHVSSQTLSSLKIRGERGVATDTGLLCNAETVRGVTSAATEIAVEEVLI